MQSWHAIVLAGGRGPDDPMAKAYGVTHKCLVPVGGVPMLARVVGALRSHPAIASIAISVESRDFAAAALDAEALKCVAITPVGESAPASALLALEGAPHPVLVTTADHALLDGAMLDHFISRSEESGADLTVGLASAETILAGYPDTRRTFLAFGPDRVSGCNLYGLMTPNARVAVELWKKLDENRKRPWRLVGAFGGKALALYALGRLDLARAFGLASERLGMVARPILVPFAEAAIDVDKPADKELVERILARRRGSTS